MDQIHLYPPSQSAVLVGINHAGQYSWLSARTLSLWKTHVKSFLYKWGPLFCFSIIVVIVVPGSTQCIHVSLQIQNTLQIQNSVNKKLD